MPLYEYQCDACAHRFEVIQKFSDAPLDTCPKCGGAVKKLLSSPAIQFKGSGWYITDYARAGKTEAATAAAGKHESGASSGEGTSETKAAAKKESTPNPSTSASS
ncbi:MAG: zinc ribbon domain-containing protein [Acidobacteria bacterium]|nr:zinc ribbon domain-containing protein [Acidobacteriota bacterium]